jgi:outer membrane protein assembly factor BamB
LLLNASCDKNRIPEELDSPVLNTSKFELIWESDVLIESPSFKIHGDKLITVYLIKDSPDSVIRAFNVLTGEIDWTFKYPINNGTWGVSDDNIKIIDDNLLFLTMSLNLGLMSIDPNTGVEKWHRSHPEAPSNGQLATRFNALDGYAYVYLKGPGYSTAIRSVFAELLSLACQTTLLLGHSLFCLSPLLIPDS